MQAKATILLKLTGAVLRDSTGNLSGDAIRSVAIQIKQLSATHHFGIVIGGGNFFRGNQQGKELGIIPAAAHEVGMLATLMNAVIIRDIFAQQGIASVILSAIACPQIAASVCHESIADALDQGKTIIFAGGTGNPFLTTDTCAIIRALQMGALQVWKATNVDGIYTHDPKTAAACDKITRISYDTIIAQRLGIMDMTAYCIAQEQEMLIRVFNIFTPNILVDCAHNDAIGSTITTDISKE
jgi:uridylate kinase